MEGICAPAHLAPFVLSAFIVAGISWSPTLLLAILLPLVLTSSWSLRKVLAFRAWPFAVAPAVIALGMASQRTGGGSLFFLLALIGVALFIFYARRDMKVAMPLAALAVLACFIAYFSGGEGGAGPMVNWFAQFGFSDAVGETLTIAIRKGVHFTFYGSVAWTALLGARSAGAGGKEAVRTALLAALTVAVIDELRQSSFTNRSGSFWDVLLDLAGALAFVGLSERRRAKTR